MLFRSADVGSNNLMADGGSYASVVAAAQATAVTPTSATPPAETPPATTPPAGPPDTGGPAAGDGGNHLVADLIALLQGGGQNSVAAVIADLAAVAQAAGGQNNGVATLLSDLQTAAAPAAPTATGSGSAPPAPVSIADAGPTAIDAHHSHLGEMGQHFHHLWG